MAYIDYSAKFSYKDLLTYQDLNQLGENDKVIWADTKTRYYTVSACEFLVADLADKERTIYGSTYVASDDGGSSPPVSIFYGIHLPHGAVITAFITDWWAANVSVSGSVAELYRVDLEKNSVTMASCTPTQNGGYHSITDSTITSGTIDSATGYKYVIIVTFQNDETQLQFLGARITYTITQPLP